MSINWINSVTKKTGLIFLISQMPCHAWLPGTYPVTSRGFTVDTTSRNDVLSFWHGVYQASEGFEARHGWTGSYSKAIGAEGTMSNAFVADVERRTNYYRAMTGISSNILFNTGSTVFIGVNDPTANQPPEATTKLAAVRRAALMFSVETVYGTNGQVSGTFPPPAYSHNPPITTDWTNVAWNGAHKGNITLNFYGPRAIDAYLLEEYGSLTSVNTGASQVGHRRWMLKQDSTNFATGDIPDRFVFNTTTGAIDRRSASNALYVLNKESERASITPKFAPYPSAGFFPAPLNSRYWTLSYPGADYTNAVVTVTRDGTPVSAPIRERNQFNAGDATLMWDMGTTHGAKSFASDRTYQISVKGIAGTNVPTSFNYSITFVNPNLITSDQTLTGTAVPHAPTPAVYTFTPPPQAESLRVQTYKEIPVTWTENAETSVSFVSRVVNRTSKTYDFLSFSITPAGKPTFTTIERLRSFRLTHHTSLTPPDQIFELGQTIIPGSTGKLNFSYKRGFMGPVSRLVTEISTDYGITWAPIGNAIPGDPIPAGGEAKTDTAATSVSINLASSTLPHLIRFRYLLEKSGQIFAHDTQPTQPTGIFIDNITVAGAKWLDPRRATEIAANATSFTLNTETQGGPMVVGEQWYLALQTRLGQRWFPDGPLKSIIPASSPPLSPFEAWTQANPGVTGGFIGDSDNDGLANGIEYAFGLHPTQSSTLNISSATDNATSEFSIQIPLALQVPGVVYSAERSSDLNTGWSSSNVTVTYSNGILKATTPLTPEGTSYLRWKVSIP